MMKLSYFYSEKAKYIIENSLDGFCHRCLSKNILNNVCFDCHNSGKTLYYIERQITIKSHSLKMSFDLSKEQKRASIFFLDHYKSRTNAFLYAVCGSGKTEIMYESILACLNDGKKPLIVIPRKEIVHELSNRLKGVFPDTKISFLDGLHHDDSGELIISTVNQLINYEDEFDLVILDEADAFPFFGNDYLHRLLKKSIKKGGVLFMMSATIKEKMPRERFVLRRRYHDHNLTMPNFIHVKEQKKAIYQELLNIIKNNNRRFIIYVSTINKARELADYLNVKWVCSITNDQEKLIDSLRSGNARVLVSTTLLERGITIKNLDVIIYDASNPVFTHQTIIQIAGRTGRSIDDPTGNVYILYQSNSLKFYLVKSYIKRMNS